MNTSTSVTAALLIVWAGVTPSFAAKVKVNNKTGETVRIELVANHFGSNVDFDAAPGVTEKNNIAFTNGSDQVFVAWSSSGGIIDAKKVEWSHLKSATIIEIEIRSNSLLVVSPASGKRAEVMVENYIIDLNNGKPTDVDIVMFHLDTREVRSFALRGNEKKPLGSVPRGTWAVLAKRDGNTGAELRCSGFTEVLWKKTAIAVYDPRPDSADISK